MARTTNPSRSKRASKRFDLSDLAALLRDRRQWVSLARVVVDDGQAAHYEIVEDDGQIVDILIDVETIPDRLALTCSLVGGWGGWWIPDLGDEVLVVIPSGEISFRPAIIAVAPATIPNPSGQGPAPGRRILVAQEVLVHNGTGGAEPLVRKSEYDALKAKYDGHMHAGLLGGTGAVPTLTSTPTANPAGSPPDPLPTITGTTVLKGS